jgi:hypothetical protein
VVATTVLRTELAEQIEALEAALADLPGIDAEEVAAVAQRGRAIVRKALRPDRGQRIPSGPRATQLSSARDRGGPRRARAAHPEA